MTTKLRQLERRVEKLEIESSFKTVKAKMKPWVDETKIQRIKRVFDLRNLRSKRKQHYQANFIKTKYGNSIRQDGLLYVKIRDADTVSGKVFTKKDNKIHLATVSHLHDDDGDTSTIQFKLKRKYGRKLVILPPGEYILKLWFYQRSNSRQGKYEDVFQIVAPLEPAL